MNDTNDVVPACTPAAFCVRVLLVGIEEPAACLLARAYQRLWLLDVDDAYGSSHILDISLSPASHRLDAGSVGKPLAGLPLSNRQRALVSAALDPAVTSYADAGRLLRTEPQVQLHQSSRVEQAFKRLQVAPFHPHPASEGLPHLSS